MAEAAWRHRLERVRFAVAASCVLACAAGSPRAQTPSDFLSAARAAIGGAAALANVRGLLVGVLVEPPDRPDATLPYDGDWLGSAQRSFDGNDLVRLWLAPPSRYLVTRGRLKAGFDGSRAIGVFPDAPTQVSRCKSALWNWMLPLLLPDPAALGLTVDGESDAHLGPDAVHAIDVSDGDGFQMRLVFAARTHRLLLTQSTALGCDGTGTGTGARPRSPNGWPEENRYGEFHRVNGLELPFTITRRVQAVGTTRLLRVVEYAVNPKDLDKQFAQ